MTQKERVEKSIHHLRTLSDPLRGHLRMLDTALDEAQNGPPDGQGDDSITPGEWNRYNELRKRLRDFLWMVE